MFPAPALSCLPSHVRPRAFRSVAERAAQTIRGQEPKSSVRGGPGRTRFSACFGQPCVVEDGLVYLACRHPDILPVISRQSFIYRGPAPRSLIYFPTRPETGQGKYKQRSRGRLAKAAASDRLSGMCLACAAMSCY